MHPYSYFYHHAFLMLWFPGAMSGNKEIVFVLIFSKAASTQKQHHAVNDMLYSVDNDPLPNTDIVQ